MAKISYHHPDGSVDHVEVDNGTSVMRAAVTHGVPGIVGECGGQAMCATCHVYVHTRHVSELPPIGEEEDEMLHCTAAPRDLDRSRLGCQLPVSGDLEVDVPEGQL